MSDPIYPKAVWQEGTLQNDVPANDNSLRDEALAREVIAIANSPSSSGDGDVFIVGSSPTGAFATFNPNDITIFRGGNWYAWAPIEGLQANGYQYTGSGGWVAGGGGGGSPGGSDTQIQFNDGGAFAGDSAFTFNKTTKAVSQAGALNEARGTAIASATTTDIGAATGTFVHVTGTTSITGLGTIQAGARRIVTFDGVLTLTHNGTSLILPTAANITTAAGDSAFFVSEGSGNWRCVGYMRANGQALSGGGGGGLTNWTDGLNSSSPNATVPVASLAATNAATNVDGAILPKGTGAFILQVPDGTATGGNKRGTNAVDLQMVRASASQVASGTRSFVAGWNNTASAQGAVALGGNNVASAQHAVAMGDTSTASGTSAVALGQNATASANYAAALGGGIADAVDAQAYGRGAVTNSVVGVRSHAPSGVAPFKELPLQASTTSATPATLTSDGGAAAATNQLYMGTANNRSCVFWGYICARQAGNSGAKKSWKIEGQFDRDNGNAALVAAVTPVVVADSGVGWSLAVTADNTLKTLKVEGTGAAATTIRWDGEIFWKECRGT